MKKDLRNKNKLLFYILYIQLYYIYSYIIYTAILYIQL